jgi:hypothetical protein
VGSRCQRADVVARATGADRVGPTTQRERGSEHVGNGAAPKGRARWAKREGGGGVRLRWAEMPREKVTTFFPFFLLF